MKPQLRTGLMAVVLLGSVASLLRAADGTPPVTPAQLSMRSGWGTDAVLSRHALPAEFEPAVNALVSAGIGVVRERGTDGPPEIAAKLRSERKRGLSVIAFAMWATPTQVQQPGGLWNHDLLEVFRGGERLVQENADAVDAWELAGEPDVGYCPEMPDRFVAYQKALYLGIKAGAAARTGGAAGGAIAVMGGLALPPGPWAQRAIKNGMLDYTDAYNFHFYGHAQDFPGVISAHAALAWRAGRNGSATALPLWVTECGMNCVRADDFLNPERRQIQAGFAAQTAASALANERVAVFTPFIYLHHGDPFSMTESPDRPLPAWTAYTQFVHGHPWPARPTTATMADVSPIVLRWNADAGSAEPHKVSGSYRFRSTLLRGQMEIYNLSGRPVRGKLSLKPLGKFTAIVAAGERELAPYSRQVVPVFFTRPPTGYAYEDCAWEFVEDDGRRSRLFFALETMPVAADFSALPLQLDPVGSDGPKHPMFSSYSVSARDGVWTATNGLMVGSGLSTSPEATNPTLPGAAVRLWAGDVTRDPLRPRVAIARVHGLPPRGFIKVGLDRPLDRTFAMCVDLVDRAGQRFTIWENFGVSYFHSDAREIWLNLQDFHPYLWGHCTEHPVFEPSAVEEIQLRCYVSKANDPRTVRLSLMVPKVREQAHP